MKLKMPSNSLQAIPMRTKTKVNIVTTLFILLVISSSMFVIGTVAHVIKHGHGQDTPTNGEEA